MSKFIKAVQGLKHSVIYTADDGKYFRYYDGTWTWRNNNPGNLNPSEFSKRHNQIGVAGGFAVFPDYETGQEALIALLKTPRYADKSIDQLVDIYAPPESGNKHNKQYKATLHAVTGVTDDTKIEDFTPEQFEALWKGIIQCEGWKEGSITEIYKISCVRVDKDSVIISYYADNLGWISKEECLNLAKQKKIEAELYSPYLEKPYLRTGPRNKFQEDFDKLIEK